MKELIEVCRQGRCMLCRQDLDETTCLILMSEGIAAAFCCGVCATDMHVVGWLQRRHEDLVSQIAFRGKTEAPGAEDEADEADEAPQP